VTNANVFLPPDQTSFIRQNRSVFINFVLASVSRVAALSSPGVYTAGDVVHLAVVFTVPVMTFIPPVLRMEVGAPDRDAVYAGGNGTDTLLFDFLVAPGDKNNDLDYVDTRKPPYNMTEYDHISLALNTDVQRGYISPTAFRYNNVLVISSIYGGIFRATSLVTSIGPMPAVSALPLPGTPGSLSATSNIRIDTSRPFVKQVLTTVPSGTYYYCIIISLRNIL